MKICFSATLILLALTAPAFATVSISSPSSGDHVGSPFTLSASSTSCSSQSVNTMGYSLDSGDTILVKNTTIDSQISTTAGTHTVHVKAWGDQGAVCVTDAAITVTNVTDDVTAETSVVPSNAVSVSSLQAIGGWQAIHDSSTAGSASGKTDLVGSPSHDGTARQFVSSYKDGGGERYSLSFGDDTTSTNFLWDGWVYFTSSSSHIANLEMDLNQTMSNGETVIFGVQCSGYSGTWEYTENLGSASHPNGRWASSSAACNPRSWKTNTWHHVQISYSRTSSGHVTYKSVYLDGHESILNHTVFAARALGWGSSLSVNFQVDGLGSSGSSTVYLDALTIKRW